MGGSVGSATCASRLPAGPVRFISFELLIGVPYQPRRPAHNWVLDGRIKTSLGVDFFSQRIHFLRLIFFNSFVKFSNEDNHD